MPWSVFVKYMLENRHNMPARVWAEIKKIGLARVVERQHAGRADSPLNFSDLISRAERAIAGL